MEGLSKEYSMDQLPTAPIGKQQVIDLNAGAILRKENKKSTTFCGINPFLLLTFIMLIKCLALGGWLYREYEVFDFGCQMLRLGGDYIYQDKFRRNTDKGNRSKRSPELDEFIQKQSQKQHKQRPVLGSSQGALTTVVTMTNLQVNRVPQQNFFEASTELEEPTIYISPIQSRNAPPIDDGMMVTVAAQKPKKKKKGKGKKKKNKNKTTPAPIVEISATTTKKKGLGRKKQRLLEKKMLEQKMLEESNRVATEQTKSPRHLIASVGNSGSNTSRPGKPNFLDGGVEHQDARNANKGHIRNYQMSKATKKPKNGIKLSEETRLMWQMNEINYTTHAMQVKTTEMTKQDNAMSSFIESLPLPNKEKSNKQQELPQNPRNEFYTSKASKHRESGPKTTVAPKPVVVALRPENKVPREGEREPTTQTYPPVAIYYETVIEPPRKPLDSTLALLERDQQYRGNYYAEEDSREYYIPLPEKKVKHGFDRSLDASIDAGLTDVSNKPTPSPKQRQIEDEDQKSRFQDELRSFTSNALCMVRTIFDTWCGCQIVTALPYLLGMCLAKRNLFVTHLICDIFFLGGGFLFSITLLVLSILLYVAVEGMSTAEFLQWLMFVVIIEVLLIGYTIIVYVCYQCTERILQARKNGYSKGLSPAENV